MKKLFYFFSVCTVLLSMVACSNNVFEDELIENVSGAQTRSSASIVEAETSTLAYILSEGDWYSKTPGSISRYNPSTNAIRTDFFKTVNGVSLGDTGNDMVLYNNMIYCLVSGHDLTSNDGGLWVISPTTGQATTRTIIQFTDPKMTGYKAMPRHMAFDNGILYISTYSGGVIAVSANDPTKVTGCKVLPAKFSEGICVVNDVVYVCNSGKEGDETAGNGNTISYFSTKSLDGTSKGVSTMQTALNPKLIKYSSEAKCFYYNALGQGALNTSLHYFVNPAAGYKTIANVKGSDFDLTKDYIYSVDMNWNTYTTSMYRTRLMSDKGDALKISGIDPSSFFGYSIVYHNGLLYVGESMSPRLFIFGENADYRNFVNTNVQNVNTVVFVN